LQPKESDIPAFLRLERVLGRFHQVAKQLQKRRTGRDTLWITDEYDVQDLLHALLKIDFNDIRAEEWTPPAPGGGSGRRRIRADPGGGQDRLAGPERVARHSR
jgi:hypothetical protein